MKKTQNIKIIKSGRAKCEETDTAPVLPIVTPQNERGLVKIVEDWVREYHEQKRSAEQTARRMLGCVAPVHQRT